MATFKQAHQALIDYTTRFNRLALDCAARGIDAITVEQQDGLGPYPKVPYQWRRRMPDVVGLAPSTVLIHRGHLEQSLSPTFCGARIDGAHQPYMCPVGHQQYTGVTREEIDG
jgi:hypothetical protein